MANGLNKKMCTTTFTTVTTTINVGADKICQTACIIFGIRH